jgi:hypothetical protein
MDKNLSTGDLKLLARTQDGFVYENPRAMPRVLFADRAHQVDFADMLRTGVWPDVDLARTVLLEDANDAPPQSGADPGRARIVDYRNTRVTVQATSPAGGWVVLADVWHPWWYAEIDGVPARFCRADVILRAVRVRTAYRHLQSSGPSVAPSTNSRRACPRGADARDWSQRRACPFSPRGRRWREAPDEGSRRSCDGSDAREHRASPGPLIRPACGRPASPFAGEEGARGLIDSGSQHRRGGQRRDAERGQGRLDA